MPTETGPPSTNLSDDDLLLRCREALEVRRYMEASDFFFEYCDRLERQGKPVPAIVRAGYALAVGHTGRLKKGIDMGLEALTCDQKDPEIHFYLAQLYLLGGSKKKAIQMLERGLFFAPEHPDLSRLRSELGVRQAPPIPLLPRSSPVNRKLGKTLHELKAKRKKRS